jgi:hypothetical protein
MVDRRYGAWMLTAVSVVLGLGLGGCAPDAPRPPGTKTSRSVGRSELPKSRSRVDAAASAAIASYRAMWEDVAEASRTSDSKNPRLDDHAESGALRLLRFTLRRAREEGATGRGAPRLHPIVVKSSASRVELRDCVDGSRWVQVKPDGSPHGLPGGSYRTNATVVLSSGTWKVSELYSEDVGTCLG